MAFRDRYYTSTPPRCAPDASALDGLDAVTLNGAEIGARHRASVRRAVSAVRQRERTQGDLLSWLDPSTA